MKEESHQHTKTRLKTKVYYMPMGRGSCGGLANPKITLKCQSDTLIGGAKQVEYPRQATLNYKGNHPASQTSSLRNPPASKNEPPPPRRAGAIGGKNWRNAINFLHTY